MFEPSSLCLYSLFIIKQTADIGITSVSEANHLADSIEVGCRQETKEDFDPKTVDGSDEQCDFKISSI